MNKILKIEEKLPKEIVLPDGNYIGSWSGYCITLAIGNRTLDLTTEEGVKGINVSVVVTVKNGEATYEKIIN